MNNINYDVNDWLHLSMKTSFNRTKLRGLNQDNVHGDNFMGGDHPSYHAGETSGRQLGRTR